MTVPATVSLRRSLIRAVPGTGEPRPVSLLSAALNLNYWVQTYDSATDAMLGAPLGGLVDALDRVAVAKRKLDSAVLRHRRARREANGLTWLRLVETGILPGKEGRE